MQEQQSSVLTVADVFCGAGGLSVGFLDARPNWDGAGDLRFEVVYGVDKDPDAIATFRTSHFKDVDNERLEVIAPCRDIGKLKGHEILEAIRPHTQVDVLVGGPSCQGVSAAGLRNPNDERNEGLRSFIRLVRELAPKWFVLENVPGLTHSNNRELLATIYSEFKKIEGYEISGDVLLAADYGVPQLRYRLFVIGTNTGSPIRFPVPTHIPPTQNGALAMPCLSTYRTVRNAIYDLAGVPARRCDEDASDDQGEQGNNSTLANHCYAATSDVNRERVASVRQGEDWRNMPVRLLPERYFATRASDQKGAYGRLLWDWPAYTITNSTYNVTSGPYTHPEHDRPLTAREAARLQTFRDGYVFSGKAISQYRQIGNAVPPRLAQAVAEAILRCHFLGEPASSWGRKGRLTPDLVQKAGEGKGSLPTMTPRFVHPEYDRRRTPPARKEHSGDIHAPTTSAWDADVRPNPEDLATDVDSLRELAKQPGNYRAAKRAKAIVQFLDGMAKEQIVEEANVSESSVRKWVDGYLALGIEGWRAYHTSTSKLAPDNPELAARLREATARARQLYLPKSDEGNGTNSAHKRLHMNGYLVELVERFGGMSVTDLIAFAEAKLGVGVGTVYVGDLLAICDVVSTLEAPGEADVSEDVPAIAAAS